MHTLSITPSNIAAFNKLAEKMRLFVKIYHPSCGHCIAMKDSWKKLSQHAKSLPYNAGIVEIHADTIQNPIFSKKYPALVSKIQGFPSLMILEKGGIPGEEYHGDRSYEDMLKFCKEHLFREKSGTKKNKNKLKGGKSKKSKKAKKEKIERENPESNYFLYILLIYICHIQI